MKRKYVTRPGIEPRTPDLRVRCPTDCGGGAMVLGKLPVPGRPTIWMIVGQGPIALAVGAGGGCLDIFTLLYLSLLFLPLFWRRPDID